jgi:hypothetical protein
MQRKATVLFVMLVALLGAGSACERGGKTPTSSASGSGSAAPAGSVAPAGYLKVTASRMRPIPGATTLPATAVLGGPDFAVYLSETATVDHLDADWLRAARLAEDTTGPLRAAEGQELLLVRLSDIPALRGSRPVGVWKDVQASVVVAGTPRRLADAQADEAVLVAAVPKGAPAQLTVSDQGRTQSVDLRTGAVGPGAIREYTLPPVKGGVDYYTAARPSPSFPGSTKVEVSATLRSYSSSGGWAPRGRTWLTVAVEVTLSGPEKIAGELDLASSLRLRSGGKMLRVPAGKAEVAQQGLLEFVASGSVAIAVPANLRSVTVSCTPNGRLTYDGRPLTYRAVGSTSATLTLAG